MPTVLGLVGRVGSGGVFPPARALGLSVGPACFMLLLLHGRSRSLASSRPSGFRQGDSAHPQKFPPIKTFPAAAAPSRSLPCMLARHTSRVAVITPLPGPILCRCQRCSEHCAPWRKLLQCRTRDLKRFCERSIPPRFFLICRCNASHGAHAGALRSPVQWVSTRAPHSSASASVTSHIQIHTKPKNTT